ncbi:UDP-N-acetylmuramoyl-L-alanine--D-glutamate ligase [Cyclobacteriaceae bacterium]|nr:UDP-N-acetylmuramoyl-L-alanine--D-glutamate ligase [Cyclobacteriaceae bacterium]
MKEKIVILGSGESGVGAAILAVQKHDDVFVSDLGIIPSNTKQKLDELGVAFEEKKHTFDLIKKADTVVKSPGIPDNTPLIMDLIAQGVVVISEIEFAFRHIAPNAKIIGITGTNGKTTTALLTYHLLKGAGLDVALAGNVGYSLAKRVAEKNYDFYVIEISSFQLDGIIQFKPDISILLNITPDHLDRYHQDFKKYVASKFRMVENVTAASSFIYCADSIAVDEQVNRRNIAASLFAVSANPHSKKGAFIDKDHLIFNFEYQEKKDRIPLADIPLIGRHNLINAMSSALCALMLEIPIKKVLEGMKSFKNAPHRLEMVAEIDQVKFINDSKATNVDAVYYALEGIKEPIIWIAGGIDKGNDYSILDQWVSQKVKGIVCLGIDNTKIENHFSGIVPFLGRASSAREAIQIAWEIASAGDVVLLSPACASFDLFINYEDRGDQFKEAVGSLNLKLASI